MRAHLVPIRRTYIKREGGKREGIAKKSAATK